MNRLEGKVAIITGAGGGICFKMSELFCQEGAKVVMVGRSASIHDKCAEIVAKGGDAISIQADVALEESWKTILDTTIEKYGTVDICVNGAAKFTMLEGDWNIDLDDMEKTLKVNIGSMVYSYRSVLNYMIENKIKGCFLNFTSSTALGWMGSGCDGYPMSKAAIRNATQTMVKQVSVETGIRFNALAPNFVWTPASGWMYEEGSELYDWFKAECTYPRFGDPADAAWAGVYLCSDEASFVNGIVLPVDGGWSSCHCSY